MDIEKDIPDRYHYVDLTL